MLSVAVLPFWQENSFSRLISSSFYFSHTHTHTHTETCGRRKKKKREFKFQPQECISEVIFSAVTQTYTCWIFYFSQRSCRWEPITGHRCIGNKGGRNSISSFHRKMEYRNKSWLGLKSRRSLFGTNKCAVLALSARAECPYTTIGSDICFLFPFLSSFFVFVVSCLLSFSARLRLAGWKKKKPEMNFKKINNHI